MTQDEIIEMARQAGFEEISEHEWTGFTNSLEAFAKLVAAKEREACAKECDDYIVKWQRAGFRGDLTTATDLSKAIRARGEA